MSTSTNLTTKSGSGLAALALDFSDAELVKHALVEIVSKKAGTFEVKSAWTERRNVRDVSDCSEPAKIGGQKCLPASI